ncbi:two-component system sensor histidine kinase LiaS [Virgibacillus siamensis]|uniref:Sensor histidine kinase n=1 Tax=Virgibacillus siamensis TaxID=480071 RepID=A0ABN1FRG0_9BACI
MLQKLSSIRYMYIRSHLYAVFLTTVILLSLLLTVYVLISPDWLSAFGIFIFILLYCLIGVVISFYAGFKTGGEMKERLDYLSGLITQFANGNYHSKIYFNENDEITRIGNEMNELGGKLQNQVKSLQRMADEKADFAKSAHKAAVIEERQRLARDLHDAVSQQLFAITMMSEASLRQLEIDPAVAKEQLQDVAESALKAQTEMRALLLHLRPVHLSGEPLRTGIKKLIDELMEKTAMGFNVVIDDELDLSDTVEEHVFRIIQEALSNTLRHSKATDVTIEASVRSKELFVHISDNGAGFNVKEDTGRKTSYGLKTMRERTEELGGTFAIRSTKGEGTYIDLRIPC